MTTLPLSAREAIIQAIKAAEEAARKELEGICLQAAKETKNEMFSKDNWESFSPDALPSLIGWLWADRQMCVRSWKEAEKQLSEAKEQLESLKAEVNAHELNSDYLKKKLSEKKGKKNSGKA